MKWIIKATIQKIISFLPNGHKINYLFQMYITKGVKLTDEFIEDKLIHVRNHLSYYNKYTSDNSDLKHLEIGTGWFPVVPLCMFLSGATESYTVDISPLLRKENIIATLSRLIEYYDTGILKQYFKIKEERINVFTKILNESSKLSKIEMLDKLNVKYLVIDATNLPFDKNYFSLITSNNTFEHIELNVLKKILIEFVRITKQGGILSHFIDMSDHFAHMDNSITIYNFLKFSNRQWSFIDNSIQPQNRLRVFDYIELFNQSGISLKERNDRKGSINDLQKVKLHKQYQNQNNRDLGVSHTHIIAVV